MTNGIILTIDLTEPCGGSGISAAIKTAASLEGHAQTAVTGVAVQNHHKVTDFHAVPPQIVLGQIHAALDTYKVGAILVGLLPDIDTINAVGALLEKLNRSIPVIVDPIIASRDGRRFLDKAAVDALKRYVFPYADLLMPNITEAEILTGQSIQDAAVLEHVAEMLLTLGPRNVFLKGFGLSEGDITEIYVDERRTEVFNSKRLTDKPVHGVGATLAAAAAVLVAQGNTPRQSVTNARIYLENCIRRALAQGSDTITLQHFVH